ncbi:MAG: outer membrane lipoprotein-sorting protein [Spirochaetaceae bacterium]|nr:MAG: outer membrane lipoprotein-sorting protein [Spirochaetaceae bacterium]
MKMKTIFVTAALGLAFLSAASAQDFKAMLRYADSLVTYTGVDFSAEYTIVRDIPKQGMSTTECAMFRRDSEKKYVIIITKPDINKGQGYLKMDDTVWFYDPESRKFNSTSSRERFQNSNARNSDFTQSTMAQDYDVVSGKQVTLGIYKCWLLDLKANNDRVEFPIMKIWISEDGLVRKAENYSLSGQLLRTMAVAGYQKIGEKFVPNKILLVDNLAGAEVNGTFVHEKTQITINRPSLKTLPDSVFSKTFLETSSR